MMDTTSNTFARRARLSTAYIALAVAVTIAAAAAVLFTSSRPGHDEFVLESPIISMPALNDNN